MRHTCFNLANLLRKQSLAISILAGWFALCAPAYAAEHAISRISIDGVDQPLADNIRAHLSIAQQPCDISALRLRRFFKMIDREVQIALRPFGHYRPVIHKKLLRNRDCWSVYISINPGERVQWSVIDITIEGDARFDPAFHEIPGKNRLKVGEPVNHADYEKLKSDILLLAASRGYLDGQFSQHILRVDPVNATAEAILHYQSGVRYSFGQVNFEQNDFDTDFIHRFSKIAPDTPYHSSAIAGLQRDLMDSGLFSRVEVRPEFRPNELKQIPVHVLLTPRKRHAYKAGFGVTTDEGLRLRLGYEDRRINRRGHSGDLSLRLSEIRQNLDFSYNLFLKDPATQRMSIQAGYQKENIEDTDSELYKIGARYIHRKPDNLIETIFLEANREKFIVGTDIGETNLIIPGIAWDWRRSDDLIHPQRGWHIGLELRGSSERFLSDVDFFRGLLYMKHISPFLGGRLITRSEIGFSTVGEFSSLPPSQRFFAGGDNSVRGYGYRELAPRNELGEIVGGHHLFTASIEFDHPISERWSFAVFADTGNAFNEESIQLHHAAGIGFRWLSPVGPIRLDFAHPFDENQDSIRVHFSLGPDL